MTSGTKVTFTVFTKPWKMPLADLGRFVKGLGFDGVELPVRPGYQVEPERVARDLPAAARALADRGLRIASIAGPTDEPTIAACAEAGVPIIRICEAVDAGGYLATEARLRAKYDALAPLLEKHGVTLGIQNHCDRFVPHALGLRRLVERYDPRCVAAVLDPAHCALDGESEEMAIDIVWSHLCMVNLKNAVWRRADKPGAAAEWLHEWVAGREGLCSWPAVAAELNRRGYAGPLCLTAEYSDEDAVDRLIAADIAFAKQLFGGA
jgi:sugar phosphate isomerase/epimerase